VDTSSSQSLTDCLLCCSNDNVFCGENMVSLSFCTHPAVYEREKRRYGSNNFVIVINNEMPLGIGNKRVKSRFKIRRDCYESGRSL